MMEAKDRPPLEMDVQGQMGLHNYLEADQEVGAEILRLHVMLVVALVVRVVFLLAVAAAVHSQPNPLYAGVLGLAGLAGMAGLVAMAWFVFTLGK
jgi:hypothetical protein